jgi:DNA polymerase IV
MIVAHLDLDAFFAAVEELENPALRRVPLIVGGDPKGRGVVATANYVARGFGIHSAMSCAEAYRRCPQAVFVRPRHALYKDYSREVWSTIREIVPTVEQAGIDEGYLDLSELMAPKTIMRRLVLIIKESTGLTASVGIGPNKLVAKIASDCEKPAGLVALSREMACERFADASPSLLPGIGPKTAERLSRMGIATLAQLRAAPEEELRRAFGDNLGRYLARRANFDDDGAVEPVRELKSQSSETTFDEDVADRERQEHALAELATDLCTRLARRDLRGRTIGIKVRLDDWTTVTRARTLDQATNDLAVVSAIALELLRAYDPPRPVRLLGVRLAAFEQGPEVPQAPQLTLEV